MKIPVLIIPCLLLLEADVFWSTFSVRTCLYHIGYWPLLSLNFLFCIQSFLSEMRIYKDAMFLGGYACFFKISSGTWSNTEVSWQLNATKLTHLHCLSKKPWKEFVFCWSINLTKTASVGKLLSSDQRSDCCPLKNCEARWHCALMPGIVLLLALGEQ